MSKRLNTDDFFICSGGLMPAKMQTFQTVAKKENGTTYYLTHVDVKTTTMVDFSCKKLMLLAALVAVLIAALIIATGGAASLLVAAAIGGAVGAAGGMLLCGTQAAAARKWLGYKVQETLVIQEKYSVIDENHMICTLFNEQILIAPKIKNWWDASLAGISNFGSEYFKCLMVGAGAAGLEVLVTQGGSAFLANAGSNWLLTVTTKGGWALRGLMGVNSVIQDHYVQGNDWGLKNTGGAVLLGGVAGPEVGTLDAIGNLTGISQAVGLSKRNTWGHTRDEWNKADGIEGNQEKAKYYWLSKASAASGVITDASAILGWGGATARERKAFNNTINALRAKAPKFGKGVKGEKGDLYSEPALTLEQAIQESAEAYKRAQDAYDALPDGAKPDKTTASDGIKTLSGWGKKFRDLFAKVDPQKNIDYSKKINHDLRKAGARDHGVPGKAHASHAEKQVMIEKPGDPLGVSKIMCPCCKGYASKHAININKPVVVTDPSGTHIFYPDGSYRHLPR
jgi:hypothetical protein